MSDPEKGQFSLTLTPTALEPLTPEPKPEPTGAQLDSVSNQAPLEDGRSDLISQCGDEWAALEKRVRWKVDLRLCSIGGLLCSLNLLDSGILSSASVTTMLNDLDMNQGNRYSVSIFIFTIASVVFQLPCTVAVRIIGPRIWFSIITFTFGLLTLCTAFVRNWQQMIILRVLLGISMSGIYPGLTYLVSAWYPRREQQLRFAFLQSGEVVILATGNIVNFGLNHLNGVAGLAGWRWMYIVQGLITCVLGFVTYWWMVDFPENSQCSFWFLSDQEARVATRRIQDDRADVIPEPFSWGTLLANFKDLKIYGFAVMFFLLNLVSTALSYFLPIILQSGMGFSSNKSILLSTPPYYYAVIPVILTSLIGDFYRVRGPLIVFNALVLIAGFLMFGLPASNLVIVRYIGTFLATGAYISNWAALNAFQANNVVGQWKRVVTAAAVTACNGLGGVAGSYIVRQQEAPHYVTAVWVSIGSHILLIAIVGAFTVYFYIANRQQGRGSKVLEGVSGFRYTY
ncbi:Major facilitator superfamily domain general substrate transporter [Penicillium cf. griseofulvum]|uniref:Major facilitator superfamily domain general substrate transporter n=1 Tax=Penicillium cf. griseofulvum TaxID=2972120 RepID=A0A9W9JNM4_9EURO|nr:Major facilitator superfamily domain general substrate transporter [Penicillium cf. griseofulvum]KAJ5423795.1 Major facilitator superfamily domain general substrate transporter [Penicillium cf. griseofulvum]